MQLIQIVLPKLIFDEERHAGVHQIKELLHIARLVERQVTHNIRPPVVFAYFVARRRKECQQNTIIGILADVERYDERHWGGNADEYALTLCLDAVLEI